MNNKLLWALWILLTILASGLFANKLFGEGSKETFLIGEATHGHYQIELACDTCHSEPFGGGEILQDACTNCHAEELEIAHDSHPKSKFTDPRNADRIEILDARLCVTCHSEHQLEQTRAMGVTLPNDYCFHCHEDIEDDRPSHKDLAFESCASAGCHNYHDNRALYEDFLVENAHQPWLSVSDPHALALPNIADLIEQEPALNLQSSKYSDAIQKFPDASSEWHKSSHALAGVDCGDCHKNPDINDGEWIEKPGVAVCQNCHAEQAESYTQGKHGMRLSEKLSPTLSPLKVSDARLPMSNKADEAIHNCNSCHGAHSFDTAQAEVSACLNCHTDEHSLAYESSPHALNKAPWDEQPMVSCSDCHMPKVEIKKNGEDAVFTQHNQNDNLRPNEKMIRPVCLQCHSLEFAINALADPLLIKNNFTGQPSKHIESIDWALKRAAE